MEEAKEILKDNRVEDISWLCSLSESELDLLISIKILVLQRAKVIGHEDLAEKFDLKTLRAMGFVLMEHLKEQLGASGGVPDQSLSAALNGCNLLDSSLEKILSIDEIMASIFSQRKKKPGKRPRLRLILDRRTTSCRDNSNVSHRVRNFSTPGVLDELSRRKGFPMAGTQNTNLQVGVSVQEASDGSSIGTDSSRRNAGHLLKAWHIAALNLRPWRFPILQLHVLHGIQNRFA